MKKNCPQCGIELDCGSRENYACWCSDLPQILSFEPKGCLCKTCLIQTVQEQIEEFVSHFKQGKIDNTAPKYDGSRKGLIEGIDYYQEGEYRVFKEWYHLRRGTCCHNDCRHCPYRTAKSQNRLIYITGGTRSGKSSYAQTLAKELSKHPIYLATARNWDEDFEKRIKRHQGDRDDSWINIEEELYPSKHDLDGKVVLIDCVTLWLTNFFTDLKNNIDACLEAFKVEINKLINIPCTLIIVSNEIGMGLHAHSEIGRKFTDLQGWANQYLAQKANEAILMVSGMKVRLK